MPDSLTLLFDGSFEGLMTAFFEAYARRPHPGALAEESACQLEFGKRYHAVATDPAKANRVVRGIQKNIGDFAYEKVWLAFLSGQPGVSQAIYRYLLWGFSTGPAIRFRLADDRALAVDKAVSLVTREAGHLREFLRFREMEGGVYYGEISPQHAVLPLLMPHFTQRFAVQPFIIQDLTHRVAGAALGGEWYITPSSSFTLPSVSGREKAIQQMWRTFYHSVAVKERINPRLQRQLMPKKYWKHLTEMAPFPGEDPSAYPPARPAFFGETSPAAPKRLT